MDVTPQLSMELNQRMEKEAGHLFMSNVALEMVREKLMEDNARLSALAAARESDIASRDAEIARLTGENNANSAALMQLRAEYDKVLARRRSRRPPESPVPAIN